MARVRTGPFENDDALDFLDDLEGSDAEERPAKVLKVLRRVVAAEDYIEAPQMAEAVAAAAVVAASEDPDTAMGEPYLPAWLDRSRWRSARSSRSWRLRPCTGRCDPTRTSGGSCGRRPRPATR